MASAPRMDGSGDARGWEQIRPGADYFADAQAVRRETAETLRNPTRAGGGVLAVLTDMIAINRILVATDFDPASESALRYGRELARSFGAALDVLHVTENVFAFAVDAYSYVPAGLQGAVEAIQRKQTDDLLDDEDRRDLHAVAATVTSNSPADAIVEYARARRIGLIVVGTHGRRAVARFVMGSVAERVVRTAPCPVLTVRSPEQEFVLPDALVPAGALAAPSLVREV